MAYDYTPYGGSKGRPAPRSTKSLNDFRKHTNWSDPSAARELALMDRQARLRSRSRDPLSAWRAPSAPLETAYGGMTLPPSAQPVDAPSMSDLLGRIDPQAVSAFSRQPAPVTSTLPQRLAPNLGTNVTGSDQVPVSTQRPQPMAAGPRPQTAMSAENQSLYDTLAAVQGMRGRFENMPPSQPFMQRQQWAQDAQGMQQRIAQDGAAALGGPGAPQSPYHSEASVAEYLQQFSRPGGYNPISGVGGSGVMRGGRFTPTPQMVGDIQFAERPQVNRVSPSVAEELDPARMQARRAQMQQRYGMDTDGGGRQPVGREQLILSRTDLTPEQKAEFLARNEASRNAREERLARSRAIRQQMALAKRGARIDRLTPMNPQQIAMQQMMAQDPRAGLQFLAMAQRNQLDARREAVEDQFRQTQLEQQAAEAEALAQYRTGMLGLQQTQGDQRLQLQGRELDLQEQGLRQPQPMSQAQASMVSELAGSLAARGMSDMDAFRTAMDEVMGQQGAAAPGGGSVAGTIGAGLAGMFGGLSSALLGAGVTTGGGSPAAPADPLQAQTQLNTMMQQGAPLPSVFQLLGVGESPQASTRASIGDGGAGRASHTDVRSLRDCPSDEPEAFSLPRRSRLGQRPRPPQGYGCFGHRHRDARGAAADRSSSLSRR
ncbi:hypothetical protein [Candidatus Laterigemmans baculatus]|uniref:hypothetical protein n=1 Tax=Candidatus Laterigemmans baculatus TaxID=2770505 RepID=UPI0013DB69D5|nr:hypothetical protein [Candidatus Laterigemmans baculatus]